MVEVYFAVKTIHPPGFIKSIAWCYLKKSSHLLVLPTWQQVPVTMSFPSCLFGFPWFLISQPLSWDIAVSGSSLSIFLGCVLLHMIFHSFQLYKGEINEEFCVLRENYAIPIHLNISVCLCICHANDAMSQNVLTSDGSCQECSC